QLCMNSTCADRCCRQSIADRHRAIYHLGVRKIPETSGGATELDKLQLRIDQLEVELERHRSQEQLIAKTLVSATSYGTVIREDAFWARSRVSYRPRCSGSTRR